MFYKEREATVDDYEFLFELKKLAEFDTIKSVFGWDESLQVVISFKTKVAAYTLADFSCFQNFMVKVLAQAY